MKQITIVLVVIFIAGGVYGQSILKDSIISRTDKIPIVEFTGELSSILCESYFGLDTIPGKGFIISGYGQTGVIQSIIRKSAVDTLVFHLMPDRSIQDSSKLGIINDLLNEYTDSEVIVIINWYLFYDFFPHLVDYSTIVDSLLEQDFNFHQAIETSLPIIINEEVTMNTNNKHIIIGIYNDAPNNQLSTWNINQYKSASAKSNHTKLGIVYLNKPINENSKRKLQNWGVLFSPDNRNDLQKPHYYCFDFQI